MTRPIKAGEQATAKRAKIAAPPGVPSTFVLSAIEGPDHGATFLLDGAQPSRALLGQSPACQIKLADPAVSRRHAALLVEGSTLRLTDLGSTNGTTVNGVSITEAQLRGGEVIRVGDTVLRVDLGAPRFVSLPEDTNFGRMIGASPAMRKLYPVLAKIAGAQMPVLLEGETGVGKELCAEEIHAKSARAAGPFVTFDCGATPAANVEAILFGKKGLFEQASGGTLFIDEIADLDLATQPRLLRAIDRSEIQRTGEAEWTKIDVRVVAATRRDLDKEILAGKFRDDLFYRLAVARVELPPLRARQGDVARLAAHFWRALGGADIPEDFLPRFENYGWPGNVRELLNAVVRRYELGVLAEAKHQTAPPAGVDYLNAVIDENLAFPVARQKVVNEFERRYVAQILARHNGSVAQAAAASGIAHRYFQLLKARQAKG